MANMATKEIDDLLTYIENDLIGDHPNMALIDAGIKKYAELYHQNQTIGSDDELTIETIKVINHNVVGNVAKGTWVKIDKIQKEEPSAGNRLKFNLHFSDQHDATIVRPLVAASGKVLFKRVGQ